MIDIEIVSNRIKSGTRRFRNFFLSLLDHSRQHRDTMPVFVGQNHVPEYDPPHRGNAASLKKVKGKCEVFRLQQDLQAWNIDGSSSDKLHKTSWIKYWEKMSGSGRRRCAFSDCNSNAEHGGHIWIKGHSSQKCGVWIVPICKKCNYCENVYRQRDAQGQHSSLRQGTVVVRTKYTPDMASAERRVSSYNGDPMWVDDYDDYLDYDEDDWDEQICEYCSIDLPFGTPKNHTKCLNCFQRGGPPPGYCNYFINGQQVTEAEYRPQQAARKAKWASHDALYGVRSLEGPVSYDLTSDASERQCEGCGDDISDKPLNYNRCLDCHNKAGRSSGGSASKQSRGRQCEGCGVDISHKPLNYNRCLDCHNKAGRSSGGSASKQSRGRQCEGCGVDISHKPQNYNRCLDCHNKAGRSSGGSASKRSHGRQCEGCGYDISHKPQNYNRCLDCHNKAGRSSGDSASKRSRGRQCEECGDDISHKPQNHSVCRDCYRVS